MITQQTPIAFSGSIPKNYDEFLGPMFFEPYAVDMTNRVSKLNPSTILEIAAGTGRLTKNLIPILKDGSSIVASDINPSMVKYGKAQTMDPKVKWMEIDAHTLPFEDGTFDCIISQFGVMFYNDRLNAFKEAWRVLKPGGTFIFNSWDEIKNNPMANEASEALKHFFPVNTPAFYSVPFSYFNESEISADLKAAGFSEPKIETVKLIGYSSNAASAAKGLIQGTPTITAIEERNESLVPEILKYLEKNITGLFGDKFLKVPLQAKVVTAIKK